MLCFVIYVKLNIYIFISHIIIISIYQCQLENICNFLKFYIYMNFYKLYILTHTHILYNYIIIIYICTKTTTLTHIVIEKLEYNCQK